jgi:hypothetical protein
MSNIIVQHNEATSLTQAQSNLPERALGLIYDQLQPFTADKRKIFTRLHDGSYATWTPDSGLAAAEMASRLGYATNTNNPTNNVQDAIDLLSLRYKQSLSTQTGVKNLYYVSDFASFKIALEDLTWTDKHLIFITNTITIPVSALVSPTQSGEYVPSDTSLPHIPYYDYVLNLAIPSGTKLSFDSLSNIGNGSNVSNINTEKCVEFIVNNDTTTSQYISGITFHNTNPGFSPPAVFTDMMWLFGAGMGHAVSSMHGRTFAYVNWDVCQLNIYRLGTTYASSIFSLRTFGNSTGPIFVYNNDNQSPITSLIHADGTSIGLSVDNQRNYLKNLTTTGSVRYDQSQGLTYNQQAQGRANIAARGAPQIFNMNGSSTYVITHNLGYIPNIVVVVGGHEVNVDTTHDTTNFNWTQFSFGSTTSFTAYIS